jgi:hypothetical protein
MLERIKIKGRAEKARSKLTKQIKDIIHKKDETQSKPGQKKQLKRLYFTTDCQNQQIIITKPLRQKDKIKA